MVVTEQQGDLFGCGGVLLDQDVQARSAGSRFSNVSSEAPSLSSRT
jgi:hypothetical protein